MPSDIINGMDPIPINERDCQFKHITADPISGAPPFHISADEYTSQEAQDLYRFFTSEYPSFVIKSTRLFQRDPMMRIERAPVINPQGFEELARQLILVALKECDQSLNRRRWYVRFVSDLIDPKYGKNTGAASDCTDFNIKKDERCFGIRLLTEELPSKSPEDQLAYLLFNILHEIYETDYWEMKKKEGSIPTRQNPAKPHYNDAEHEIVANSRAFKTLKTIYPNLIHRQW